MQYTDMLVGSKTVKTHFLQFAQDEHFLVLITNFKILNIW